MTNAWSAEAYLIFPLSLFLTNNANTEKIRKPQLLIIQQQAMIYEWKG
jgi:hypothetical protein